MIISPSTRPTPSSYEAIPLGQRGLEIQPQVALAPSTTYRVGGAAEWYATPRDFGQLCEVMAWYNTQQIPLMILGAGSNLLISDHGLPGLVINTRYLRSREFDEDRGLITVAAGMPVAKIGWQAAKRGWRGLEWAVGIPGTVGGAVVMNAGAHNQCTAQTLISVKVMHPDGSIEVLTNEQLGFAYRTSILQGDCRVVIEATFQLETGFTRDEVMTQTTHNLHHRKSTQPYDKPSCGSVFRNPKPLYAAKLIEGLGLKSFRIGGAEVSQQHANFIVNIDNAKAQDVRDLIFYVREQVSAHHNVEMETEVKLLGEFK